MSADSPRRSGNAPRGMIAVPAIVPPQVVSDRSILDSAIGFINEVTLAHQPHTDPKDTITWARFETAADISDPRFGEDWELEGNVAPPLLLILGYGLGVQVWAIPANGEAVEVLSWRHGIVSALRVLPTPSSSVAIEENGRADEPTDVFAEKRPLIALVDGSSSSGSQPQFCAVNFISLKTGTQVKAIKFKNPVIDVLANRSSIVITFHERIAVFDARTLEDRLSITTCYPSPGINPNPIALGPRWLAYAEHKLIHSKRSGGGCDGEGVASYTATVLNASKSLVKGLRELGEQVAAGLTGTSGGGTSSKNTSFDSGVGPESKQSGVVTIIDIKNPLKDYSPTSGVPMSSASSAGADPIVAHFIAHSEALVAMEFDNSGMLLITADRRGHDFHVFRIQPNPVGPSLAAVHHLYVLHRGDTSAKVQNISFSLDSRWVAVSTLRGTTHVFPITPYGGPMGVRTHSSLHVVNKLSRFHRSAGLSAEGRSNSPISHSESTTFTLSLQPYHNTTLPPYPRPTVVMPLAQLRQPFALGSPPGSATLPGGKTGTGGQGSGSQRQRLSSLSDDSGKPLSVCAIFAKSRSWLLDPPNVTREAPHRMQRKAVDSLFVMAGHGALIQYDLDTKLASNVAKEKICDDTPIELEVEAKAQWNLGRRKEGSQEIMPPLTLDNWLVKSRNSCMLTDSTRQYDDSDDRGDSWLAQVEIVTHAGPHRRLWMGPQFVFKTYNTPSGSNLSHVDIEAVEIGTNKATTAAPTKPDHHSSPLNMPLTAAGRSSAVPVLIESGSYSSIEQSPKLMDRFRHDHLDSDYSVAHGDTRLKEDLADAMRESPSVSAASKESGSRGCETTTGCSSDNIAFYDALADHDDDQDPQDQDFVHTRNAASAAALASALPNICSYDNSSSYESIDSLKKPKASIEKIVNPLGTVTTVTSCLSAEVKTDILDEVVSQLAAEDTVIHENCDESLFRPVVAIFCDEKTRLQQVEEERKQQELCQPPENMGNKLVVPVIEKEVNDELNKKQKEKNFFKFQKTAQIKESDSGLAKEQSRFDELSSLNKMSKVKLPVVEKEPEKREEKKASKEIVKDKAPKCSEKTKQLSQCREKTPERKCVTKKVEEKKECQQRENIQGCSVVKESEKVVVDNNKAKKNETVEKMCRDLAKKEKPQQISHVHRNECEKSNISLNKECAKSSKKEQKEEKTVEQATEMTKDKESMQPVMKPQVTLKKTSDIRKELTPEREHSPKLSNNNTAKPLQANEPERDMRTRQASEEKTGQQKPLTKKELKKQQLQKAQEDTAAQSIQSEKETIEATKKTVEKIETKKSENDKEMEKDKEKVAKSEVKETIAKGNKGNNIMEQSKVCNKAPKETTPPPNSNSDNTTAVVTLAKPEQETCSSKSSDSKVNTDKHPAETADAKDNSTAAESLQTAVKLKAVATEKTAIREDIKNNSTSSTKAAETEITTSAKKVTSNLIIKTEHLNVKDLADSLIELKTADPEEEPVKKEKETATVIPEKIPKAAITPPMETVDIFTAPVKAVNTNKKTDNKSIPTSSESEEIVPIVKASTSLDTTATANVKAKSTIIPTPKKKYSTSSEESNTDLAENKKQDSKETPKEIVEPGRIGRENEKEKEEEAKAKAKLQKKIAAKEASKQQLKKSKESETMKDQAKAKSDVAKKQVKKSETFAEFVERIRISDEKEEEERKIKEEARAKARLQRKLLAKEAIMQARKLRELEWAREDEEIAASRRARQKLMEEEQAKIANEKDQIDKKEVDVKKQEKSEEEKIPTESSILQSSVNTEESKMNTKENAKTKSDSPGVKPKVIDDSSKKDIATVLSETDTNVSVNIKKSAETDKCNVESSVNSKKTENKTHDIEKSDIDIQSTSSKKSEEKAQTKSSEDNEQSASNRSKKPVEQQRDNLIESENKKDSNKSVEKSKDDNKGSELDKESLGAKIKSQDVAKKSLTVKKDNETKIVKTESKIDEKTSSVQVTKDDDSDESGKQQQKVPAGDKLKSEQIKKTMAKVTTQTKSDKIESKQANKPTATEKLEVKESAKELKKSDDTTSLKEIDVVVQQPRKNPANELMEALQKKEKVTKRDDSDKVTNTGSSTNTKSDTKTKTTSQPAQSPKKVEAKQVKTENVKPEMSAAKTLAKVTPKDMKDSSKNVTSIEAGKIPTSASVSKQENLAEDAKNSNSEKHDDIYKIKVTETWSKAGTSADTATKTMASVIASAPIASAWKTLSGADMIAINLKKHETKTEDPVYPSLGAGGKSPKNVTISDKLLPELPTPKTASSEKSLEVKKSTAIKKSKIAAALDDFPTLQPLEPFPPLPALEPLELISNSKISSNNKDVSLINFESPLQENPAMERKITPPPRGFTEQNLIFALCGSLHYENEQSSHVTRDEKCDVSPMTPSSSNRSSSALDEPSMADYKSLTENDDPYISLEQSSQDTNTTNTNTTNEKFSSSTNSSGTEEMIIVEEKKMTKKQKRKRQQQLLELQKHKEQRQQQTAAELDDEELRPLIAMSESQLDNIADTSRHPPLPTSLLDDSFSMKPLINKSNALTHSTTTDSEGPMPATTSDDNVFIMPSAMAHAQHKIKTKKMDHKFNLIAAIEAATSSSTSSAEESGVEMGGGRSHDNEDAPPLSPSLKSTTASGSASASSVLPMGAMTTVAAGAAPVASLGSTVGGLKKKTKRRKR